MADLAFFLDYAPLLSAKKQRAAMVLYIYYDKFSDGKGFVTLTYDELRQCLGFSTRIISEADAILQEMGLLRIPSSEELKGIGVNSRTKVRQIISLEFMDDKARDQAFLRVGLQPKSNLRLKFRQLHMTMPEYQRLINVSSLERAYTELGPHFQVLSKIAKYFELDYKTMRLVLEDKEFKTRFHEMAQLAKDNIDSKKSVTQKKKRPRITAREQYEQLMAEAHMTRKSKRNPVPRLLSIEEWKSPAVLRYFCVKYEQKYHIGYTFTSSPFRGREMGECKRLLGIFSPVEVKKYLDWLFDGKRNVNSPAVALYPNILNEYRRLQVGQSKINPEIGSEFIEWVHNAFPDFTKDHSLKRAVDLQWLQKLVQQKVGDKVIEQVVNKACEMGILSNE